MPLEGLTSGSMQAGISISLSISSSHFSVFMLKSMVREAFE